MGLRTEHPPVEKKMLSLGTEFVEVESVRPTLRWEPFPHPADPDQKLETRLDRISHVTYELRIWETRTGRSGNLVYARDGLRSSEHRVETPLASAMKYLWTVRAAFRLDGEPRVTAWALAGLTRPDQAVPNASCYRFRTPPVIKESS